MTEWTVDRLARAMHADHGLLLKTTSWLDEEGKWHRWTDDYCLKGDRLQAEKLIRADKELSA